GTWRFPASRLKKSTLRWLSESVTFTFVSRIASLSGEGRKSFTTFTLPISPSVYLIGFLLIDFLAFPPVACAENPDATCSPSEPHSHHVTIDFTKAEISLFAAAVAQIFGDHTAPVEECSLSVLKSHAVFGAICAVLGFVPFEVRLLHMAIMPYKSMVVSPRHTQKETVSFIPGSGRISEGHGLLRHHLRLRRRARG